MASQQSVATHSMLRKTTIMMWVAPLPVVQAMLSTSLLSSALVCCSCQIAWHTLWQWNQNRLIFLATYTNHVFMIVIRTARVCLCLGIPYYLHPSRIILSSRHQAWQHGDISVKLALSGHFGSRPEVLATDTITCVKSFVLEGIRFNRS